MQSIRLHARVGNDGILKLQTPIKYKNAEVDVVLVVNVSYAEKGWPPGFLDRFAGCMPDLPDRAPQGEYEVREPLE